MAKAVRTANTLDARGVIVRAFDEADRLHGGPACGGTIVMFDAGESGFEQLFGGDAYGDDARGSEFDTAAGAANGFGAGAAAASAGAGDAAGFVDALGIPGVEVWCLEPGRSFELKRRLNGCLDGKRILLLGHTHEDAMRDWFADVSARAYLCSLDPKALVMRELGLPDVREMHDALGYLTGDDLNSPAFRKKLIRLREASGMSEFESVDEFLCGVLCAKMGAPRIDAVAFIATWLLRAYCDDLPARARRLDMGVGWAWLAPKVAEWCGCAVDGFAGAADAGLACARTLTKSILLCACARSVTGGVLDSLQGEFSADQSHAAFCRSVVDFLVAEGHRDELLGMATDVERSLGIEGLLADVNIDHLVNADVFPCIDAAILRTLFRRVAASPEDADAVLAFVAARRGKCWYEVFSCYYEGVVAAARMQRFYREHMAGFGGMTATALWKAYTGELYRMDTWYRDLRFEFRGAYKAGEYELDEDFGACCAAMERLYKGWFVKELARAWSHATEGSYAARGYAEGVPRQVDFDLARVEPLARGRKRTWVIVSDALRFEVAAELAQVLERETKGVCSLDAMQAVFPSITKCGMAALLPHGTYAYEAGAVGDDGAAGTDAGCSSRGAGFEVLVDGSPARGVEERGAVLVAHYPGSVAVRYDRLVNDMDRAARKELVSDAKVVYVYHDVIDAMGDKLPTERKVFLACREAIDELATLVKLIVRENAGANVLITADHGFLYSAQPLAECDHALRSEAQGSVVEAGRRWMVARAGAESDVLMPVAVPGGSSELVGFAPREDVRLRMAGGGENFVHGGLSLQEVCVPVLSFTNKRVGSQGYVESRQVGVSLVTQLSTVSNSSFALELLQNEPVGGKILPAVFGVFAVCDGVRVSDTSIVVANLEDADAAARLLRVLVTINPSASVDPGTACELVARNVDTGEETTLRELTLQIIL